MSGAAVLMDNSIWHHSSKKQTKWLLHKHPNCMQTMHIHTPACCSHGFNESSVTRRATTTSTPGTSRSKLITYRLAEWFLLYHRRRTQALTSTRLIGTARAHSATPIMTPTANGLLLPNVAACCRSLDEHKLRLVCAFLLAVVTLQHVCTYALPREDLRPVSAGIQQLAQEN